MKRDKVDYGCGRNPSWPSLTWALIYLSIWTSLAGLLYPRRLFLRFKEAAAQGLISASS